VDAEVALLRRQARDACFADASWMADPGADLSQALAPAMLVAALSLLGDRGSAGRAEPELRRWRRFQI
jgi:hypothetical protein